MLVAYQRKSSKVGKPASTIENSRLWYASRVSCVTSTQHIGVQPLKHKPKEKELKRESEDSYSSCLPPLHCWLSRMEPSGHMHWTVERMCDAWDREVSLRVTSPQTVFDSS